MAIQGFKPHGTPTVKILESKSPIVIISDNALFKMKYIVKHSPKEVGWLGSVTKKTVQLKDYYVLDDIFIFEQEVHATTTEITPEGLSSFAEKLLERADGIEVWNTIKMWGHSHVNMSVTPSGQDDTQMKVFEENSHDFFMRIIANKAGELRLDLYDFESGLVFNCIEWQNQVEEYYDLEKEIMEELKTKVKEKSCGTATYVGQGYNTGYGTGYGAGYGSYYGNQTPKQGIGKTWWEQEREKNMKKALKSLDDSLVSEEELEEQYVEDQLNIWKKENKRLVTRELEEKDALKKKQFAK